MFSQKTPAKMFSLPVKLTYKLLVPPKILAQTNPAIIKKEKERKGKERKEKKGKEKKRQRELLETGR